MILYLSNNCLFKIFEYLELSDHVALFNTSTHLWSPLKEAYRQSGSLKITQQFWQQNLHKDHEFMFEKFWNFIHVNIERLEFEPTRKQHNKLLEHRRLPRLKHFKYTNNRNNQFNNSIEMLKNFLHSNHKKLQYLSLENCVCDYFQVLRDLRIPTLTHFELHTEYMQQSFNYIGKMFPNLETLAYECFATQSSSRTIRTSLTETGFQLFDHQILSAFEFIKVILNLPLKKLTMINVIHENDFKTDAPRICYKLISHCQTLEELSLDSNAYYMLKDELGKLQKLRKLHIQRLEHWNCKPWHGNNTCLEHFGKIAQVFTIKLVEPVTKMRLLPGLFCLPTNVELLKIISDDDSYDYISSLAKVMPNLREFHYCKHARKMDYNDVFSVLKYCRNIEILDFTGTKCDARFLKAASNAVQKHCGYRQLPLIWRFNPWLAKMEDLQHLHFCGFQFSNAHDYLNAKEGMLFELFD